MAVVRNRLVWMTAKRLRSIVSTIALAFAILALAACGDDGDPIKPPDGGIDAFNPPWWTPSPGEASNWDDQLVAPLDVSTTRQMYTLDLWDVATAGTIDEGGGVIVTVPAGPLAGKIDTLHGAGAKVVCHIDAGAIRLTDPDAMRFPGFATPPDRPTMPAAGSVIGWSVVGDPNTRYLDLRTAGRTLWQGAMRKRFDYAKTIGCDGIDAGWIDQADPGFPLVTAGNDNDITLYYADVVAQLHNREISAGWHASTFVGKSFADAFSDSYDFAVVERCAEFDECDLTRVFQQKSKAVFGIDYDTTPVGDRDADGTPDGVTFALGCARTNLPTDWIHKDADPAFRPSNAYRMARAQCP